MEKHTKFNKSGRELKRKIVFSIDYSIRPTEGWGLWTTLADTDTVVVRPEICMLVLHVVRYS